MKITRVIPWLANAPRPYLDTAGEAPGQEREYVFVQVSTDEGLTGWGEITGTSRWANRAVCAILAQVSELIEGDDPTHIEAIWNKVFRAFTYMGTRGATSNVSIGQTSGTVQHRLVRGAGRCRKLPCLEAGEGAHQRADLRRRAVANPL